MAQSQDQARRGRLPAEHPLRRSLHDEVHARPFEPMTAPLRLSHLAVLTGEDKAGQERVHLAALCRRFGVEAPAPDATQVFVDLGGFRLRWERHTEFSTYGFIVEGGFEEAFSDPIINRVPADWLEALPGQVIVALHVAVEGRDAPRRSVSEVDALFGSEALAGSRMSSDAAAGWTDFRICEDGFSRIFVQDYAMGPRRTGRLIRRLLELETYRMMALLAFTPAREAGPALSRIGGRLTDITAAMADSPDNSQDRKLLDELSGLAAELERIGARLAYRLGAMRAYNALVDQRLEEIRENRLEGLQTIAEFLSRRYVPAIRTCESVQLRLDQLTLRVTRASEMLRTRVDVHLEAQNRDLLASMDRRAKLQLRLQETVEGLSVAAISYYVIGLIGYLAKGMKVAGAPVPPDLVTGAAIPLVVLLVWFGMRRMRRRLSRQVGE